MAKLGFTGLALAGCLALTSCNTTSGGHLLPSAFDYPEAKAYVDCVVAQTRKLTLARGKQLRNTDVYEVDLDAQSACEPIEKTFRAHAKANGLPVTKLTDLIVELRTKAADLAWDEFARIRLAQLKAGGQGR